MTVKDTMKAWVELTRPRTLKPGERFRLRFGVDFAQSESHPRWETYDMKLPRRWNSMAPGGTFRAPKKTTTVRFTVRDRDQISEASITLKVARRKWRR